MLKQKKAITGGQLVLLIIALVILGFLLYRILFSQDQSMAAIEQIKGSLFG